MLTRTLASLTLLLTLSGGASSKPQASRSEPARCAPVADDLGGWDKIQNDTVFGPSGAITEAQKAAQ